MLAGVNTNRNSMVGIDDGVDKFITFIGGNNIEDQRLAHALNEKQERTVRVQIRQPVFQEKRPRRLHGIRQKSCSYFWQKPSCFIWEHPWRRRIVKLSLDRLRTIKTRRHQLILETRSASDLKQLEGSENVIPQSVYW